MAKRERKSNRAKSERPKQPRTDSMIGAVVLDDLPVHARFEELQAQAPNDFRNVASIKKRAMLVAMSQLGTISASLAIANICRRTHEYWMNEDEQYAELWQLAKAHACELMEAEARRRAVMGTLRPVFYKGMECGKIREYSDTLLIFLLKANNPEKFGDATLGMLTGNAPGTIINAQQIVIEYQQMMDPAKQVESHCVGGNGHGGNGTTPKQLPECSNGDA